MVYYSHCLCKKKTGKGECIMDVKWVKVVNFYTEEKGFFNVNNGFIPISKWNELSKEKQKEIMNDVEVEGVVKV